jgi:hypothetical protein
VRISAPGLAERQWLRHPAKARAGWVGGFDEPAFASALASHQRLVCGSKPRPAIGRVTKGTEAMNLESKQQRQTRQVELVETHNLAISIRRLSETQGYGSRNWKRALYHALSMSSVAGDSELQKMREAMGLP